MVLRVKSRELLEKRCRAFSEGHYFCCDCGVELIEGSKVFVLEKCWQRVARRNGVLVLVQCSESGFIQFLLCKKCELEK